LDAGGCVHVHVDIDVRVDDAVRRGPTARSEGKVERAR
jgi:hypothetical protein